MTPFTRSFYSAATATARVRKDQPRVCAYSVNVDVAFSEQSNLTLTDLDRSRQKWTRQRVAYITQCVDGIPLSLVHSIWTELNWTDLQQVDPVSWPGLVVTRARRRHDLIGCSETGTVSAQPVPEILRVPIRLVKLESANWSSVRLSFGAYLCAANKPLLKHVAN